MNEELDGLIASIDFTPSIDTSQIDNLINKIDKLESEEHKIDLYVNISPDDEEAIKDTLGDIVEYAEALDVKLKVDIDGDFNTLIYNLKQLERIIRKLPVIKADGNISTPQVASRSETKKATSIATARKATTSVDEEVKNYADAVTYTRAVLSELNKAFKDTEVQLNDYSRHMKGYDSELTDKSSLNRQFTKTNVDSRLNTLATRINSAINEITNIYKQSLKIKDGTAEQILDLLKQADIIPDGTELTVEEFKQVVTNEWQKYVDRFKEIFSQGIEIGKYKSDDKLKEVYRGGKNSEQIDELRDIRLNDIQLIQGQESTSEKFSVKQIDENTSKYVGQLVTALQSNTDVINKDNTETTEKQPNDSFSGGISVKDLHDQLQKFLTALNRGKLKNIKDDVGAIKTALIESQNIETETKFKENDAPTSPLGTPQGNSNNDNSKSQSAWSKGAVNLVGSTLLDIKEDSKQISGSTDLIFEDVDETKQDIKEAKAIINGIYNKISNGIQVTNNGSGNTPVPAPPPSNAPSGGGNPKPKKPAPQNPTPLPSRTRNEISIAAEKELTDITKEIEDINFLLRQTGGIAESVLPEDDVKRTLNDLTAISSQLKNIIDISNKKYFGAKDLVQINDYLTDVENKLQNITPEAHNIIGLTGSYSDAFKNERINPDVYKTYAKLKKIKEALETAHVDTSQYDKAIDEIDARIERLENTAKSWRSTNLTPDQIDTARDAVTQMSDELYNAVKRMQSLADNADDQAEDIFKFDDEITELNKLENKITSFYKIIQDLRRKGIDPSSIVFGNGYNLGDAESIIQEYFNKKDTLNQYSQGQFASEAEFEQYRTSIRVGLIEPINEYISHTNDAKIATENLKTANKKLADEVRNTNSSLTLDKQIENKIIELNKWREANSRAMTIPKNAAEFERFMDRLNQNTITDPTQMKAFNAEWSEFNKRIVEAGQNGKTTTSILAAMYKKFGGWTLVTRTITQGIRLMKDMVNQVKEVDTAMVNLRKVTDASEQSLEKYQQTAAKASIRLGTSLTDQIDATSIFSRLGYELDEAEKLGEIASMYKSVAEDLDIDTASQSIISTLKAYQGLGTTAEEIVDKFNYVGKMLPLITISVKGQRCLRPR